MVFALLTFTSILASSAAQEPDIPIIDTHVHLWDLNRPEGIYWIKQDDHVLRRSMLPDTHEPIARGNKVGGVVVVQAGQHLPDNQWNLDVTAHNPTLYRGVVGNLSNVIGTDEFKPLFLKLCKDDRYVGYRLSGRYQDELTEDFFRDLELTAKLGKTVDFLVGGYTLEEIATIANRVPDLKIMLDHFGNVRLSEEPLETKWIEQFKQVARHRNVYCKVSALYGRFEQQPAPTELEVYQPILDLAFASFGEDRLVYGSDWPVTRTTADYAAVVRLVRDYFDEKGRDVSEKLFYRNAVSFYGIESTDD